MNFENPVRHPPNPHVGVGMKFPPVPPAPVVSGPAARLIGPGAAGKYGENMTLAALMARQKELAAQQQALGSQPAVNIPQGLSLLANTFVNALASRRARQAEEEANAEVANAWATGFDMKTGEMSPEALAVFARRQPDVAASIYEQIMTQRANAAKQDQYGPVISGEAAKALGLDPTKQYQLNKTTGQYDTIGGGGVTVNTGTDKLTESAARNLVLYPQVRNATLELTRENLDAALSDKTDAAAFKIDPTGLTVSDKFKRARTAAIAWVTNLTYAKSGAQVPETEVLRLLDNYFPVIGDGPDQIAYKRQLRESEANGLRYPLESTAPETLKKLDADYDALVKRYADEDAKKKAEAPPAPDATQPAPDATTPAPDATTPPATVDSFPTKEAEGTTYTEPDGTVWKVINGRYVKQPKA